MLCETTMPTKKEIRFRRDQSSESVLVRSRLLELSDNRDRLHRLHRLQGSVACGKAVQCAYSIWGMLNS